MIDTIPSQAKVHQLLRKSNRSRDENEELVSAIKKGAYDMPDVNFSIVFDLAKKKQNTSDQSITFFNRKNSPTFKNSSLMPSESRCQ